MSDWGGSAYSVMSPDNPSGPAAGDGIRDDSGSWQAAATAAIAANGTLVAPPPPSRYRFGSTVNIVPASGSQVYLDVEAQGRYNAIDWKGGNNAPVFRSLGWKQSLVRGVKIDIPATASGVVGWDVDADAARSSTSVLTFQNSHVAMERGASGCVGWRGSHSLAGADISMLDFLNCKVAGGSSANGNTGWLNESLNGLDWHWFGGWGSSLDTMYSNSMAKFATRTGGAAMYFYGLSGGNNLVDYALGTAGGTYLISGGRYELGKRFLQVGGVTGGFSVVADAVQLASYTPADGIVFNIDSPIGLSLTALYASGADYSSAFFTLRGAISHGSLALDDCRIQGAADPFIPWTAGSQWKVVARNCKRLNGSSQAVGDIPATVA